MDAKLIEMILKEHGISNIETVGDGAEALDYLHRRGLFSDRLALEPALVLLDLKMPRTSGWEVLQQAKEHPCLKLIPIVILTSSGDAHDVERAYALGANAYLIKQMDYDHYSDMLGTAAHFWLDHNQPPPGCLQPKE